MLEVIKRESGFTPKLAARQLNNVNRVVAIGVGSHWHRVYLPEHFTHRGATKYKYTERNPGYQNLKRRIKGHTYPLVFSGTSRELARIRDVRATATRGEARVRVVIHAHALNFQAKDSRVRMRDEVRVVTQDETIDLENVAVDLTEQELNNLRGSTTEKL